MKKARLTRQQSQEQTRQRLLDAARDLFITHGYGSTSVEHIAKLAGYSRGAFYSNFQDRGEIFVAVLQRDHERIMGELHALLDVPPADGDTAQPAPPARALLEARLLAYYAQIHRDANLHTLLLEARLYARRDTSFCTHFQDFQRRQLDAVTRFADDFAQRAGLTLALDARDLALGFTALCEGMALCHVSDGSIGNTDSERVLQAFMKRVAFEVPTAGVATTYEPPGH